MRASFLILSLFVSTLAFSQGKGHLIMESKLHRGEYIPITYLDEVKVTGFIGYLTQEEIRKYARLIHHVKKTYPYAKEAGELLRHYNNQMIGKTEAQRKALMKKAEKDIEREFSPALKQLNRTQGRILIRLVDRETGSDSYSLVKELRGSIRAFFYQSIGRLFGYNLRTKYDPVNNKEDFIIEKIIFAIESKRI